MARYGGGDYRRYGGVRGPGHDMEFGNWGDRSGLRGYEGGGYGGGRGRLSGMESNRYRGVYGSGSRVGYDDAFRGHGRYRGTGWNRGGGMNPGRYDRGWR